MLNQHCWWHQLKSLTMPRLTKTVNLLANYCIYLHQLENFKDLDLWQCQGWPRQSNCGLRWRAGGPWGHWGAERQSSRTSTKVFIFPEFYVWLCFCSLPLVSILLVCFLILLFCLFFWLLSFFEDFGNWSPNSRWIVLLIVWDHYLCLFVFAK